MKFLHMWTPEGKRRWGRWAIRTVATSTVVYGLSAKGYPVLDSFLFTLILVSYDALRTSTTLAKNADK